jgi:hypothetical protein
MREKGTSGPLSSLVWISLGYLRFYRLSRSWRWRLANAAEQGVQHEPRFGIVAKPQYDRIGDGGKSLREDTVLVAASWVKGSWWCSRVFLRYEGEIDWGEWGMLAGCMSQSLNMSNALSDWTAKLILKNLEIQNEITLHSKLRKKSKSSEILTFKIRRKPCRTIF